MKAVSQQGFLLPIALVAVLMLAMLMVPLIDGVSISVDRVQRARMRFGALLAIEQANTTVLLSSLTQGATSADIRTDGTGYAVETASVGLQDLRGLVALDGISGSRLRRILSALGVAQDEALALTDAYFDYIDSDDFSRAGGSERDAYAAVGLPPPRDAPLLTPSEALNIVGWRDQPALWRDDAWARTMTTRGPGGFDPKTAPRAALMSLEGVSGDLADALIAARDSVLDLLPREARHDGRGLVSSPSGTLRVTLAAGAIARRTELRITATDPSGPWRVDWSLPVPLSSIGFSRTHDDLPVFPPLRIDPVRP